MRANRLPLLGTGTYRIAPGAFWDQDGGNGRPRNEKNLEFAGTPRVFANPGDMTVIGLFIQGIDEFESLFFRLP
jgi:hypothetical protein